VTSWQKIHQVVTDDDIETMALGTWLIKKLRPGNAVALIGQLGAGKTTFVRGLVRNLGFEGRVRSPSFTLMNSYPTSPPIFHADLYRLGDSSELLALGINEELDNGGILFVEWADKFESEWGDADWKIEFEVDDISDKRTITFFQAV
jgi:tRNA threonylcarbamoyladenosine biosynthesis protein TsaE